MTATGFTTFPCDRGVSTGLNRGWHDFVVSEGVAVCRLCGRRPPRAVLAVIPPLRCAPSENEVAKAVAEASGGTVGTLTSRAQKIARAVLDLFAAQPTVAQAKAEAWSEGYAAGRSDEYGYPAPGAHANPYAAIENGGDR